MKIAMIGLGYIGLPTAIAFAQSGVDVYGVDIDSQRLQDIADGSYQSPEPGLSKLIEQCLQLGTLKLSSEIPNSDIYIIAVPTPVNASKAIDTSFLENAIRNIAPRVSKGSLIIIESTVSPGTTAAMARLMQDLRPDLKVDQQANSDAKDCVYFAHCPERILPGHALHELRTNDRIIGGLTTKSSEVAAEVYSRVCSGSLLLTDALTAEMAKVTENAFRDVNIAFANELSIISANIGVDVWELISLANRHPRVNILNPGPGVGGHCIAVDPWFLVNASPGDANLIRTARQVNDAKPNWVSDQILKRIAHIVNPCVAVYGLSFKPDIDDLRASPSITVVQNILSQRSDASVLIVEPHIAELPTQLNVPRVTLIDGPQTADVDIAAILVNHSQFEGIDQNSIAPQVIDLRPPSA